MCVVGPGTRFLSGITYYTFALSSALDEVADVCVLLMRRLLPARLYPGRRRVGTRLSSLTLPASVDRFDGVDWFWVPSLFRAAWFLIRRRPRFVVFQWWTGTVLHTYLVLALVARLVRARLVIELHEAQDVGEEERPWARRYVEALGPTLFRAAAHFVVHSAHDCALVTARYGIDASKVSIIPHAVYDHYDRGAEPSPHDGCNLLYFGVIRPFKGVEDLVLAFDSLPPDVADDYRLTIVGETWEDWTLPGELIAASRYRNRITFVNRYVTDDEVDAIFRAADVVVLPYRRSSQSGPLHIAMHYGLPVVVTAVGGLVEAVEGYGGAVLVHPGNAVSIASGITRARERAGTVFANPRDWSTSAARYCEIFRRLEGPDLETSSADVRRPELRAPDADVDASREVIAS